MFKEFGVFPHYYKVKNILQLFNDDDYKNFFSNLSKSIKILSVDEKNYSDVKKIIAKEHFDLFVINSNSNESIINDFFVSLLILLSYILI